MHGPIIENQIVDFAGRRQMPPLRDPGHENFNCAKLNFALVICL
jgi:hypothetical protein